MTQDLKTSVRKMMIERATTSTPRDSGTPTPIWTEVLGVFSYLQNLTDEDFRNIRFHTYLVTGESILRYWHPYPPIDPERFAETIGYKFYTDGIPDQVWVSEPPAPGIPRPVGVNYRGKIINHDVCRYQSCVSNLYTTGVLKNISEAAKRPVILEIGGGYGGLAHALSNVIGNSVYVIIDLPEMFLFSGNFLRINNPGKKIYVYERETFSRDLLNGGIFEYDFALLPNYILEELRYGPDCSLLINMQSFQEMSEHQIRTYLEFASKKVSGYLYSDNMDFHPYNQHLAPSTVTSLLEEHFLSFPERNFYDRLKSSADPWFYRQYICVNKGRPDLLSALRGQMRLVHQTQRYFLHYNGGTKYKVEVDRRGKSPWQLGGSYFHEVRSFPAGGLHS